MFYESQALCLGESFESSTFLILLLLSILLAAA